MKTRLMVALGLMFCAQGALAQQAHKWYAGVDIGQAELERLPLSGPGVDFDNQSTAYTLRGGYRFSRFYALEVGYTDLGEFHGSTDPVNDFDISNQGFLVNNVFIWPVARHFELNLMLGAVLLDRKFTARGAASGSFEDSGVVPKVALGFSVPLNERLAFNLEWSQYADFAIGLQTEPDLDLTVEDTRMFSLGVRWSF
ncbi:MAG TPA: outer membrane beta-barrel protein [Steroidobacteraceae bacterium]|nr:outer membrane beta-barrel protein [Steroidobacteraceae bacterium]